MNLPMNNLSNTEKNRPSTKCTYSDEWEKNVYCCDQELREKTKDDTIVHYCIFHDREYVNNNENKKNVVEQNKKNVVEQFRTLVETAKNKGKTLVCRSFYLPEIDFERL